MGKFRPKLMEKCCIAVKNSCSNLYNEVRNNESHQKYIDVQILLDGQEEMAWMELDDLTEAIPYDAEKDAARWDGERTHHMLITKDMFYIAYPHDGHKAVSHVDEKSTFTKIILKLPV